MSRFESVLRGIGGLSNSRVITVSGHFRGKRKGTETVNPAQWFRDQLQASADGFVWGVEQVPVERRLVRPPAGLRLR